MSGAHLDHIGIVVSDLERALAFWRDAVGLAETGRGVAGWPHLSPLNGLDAVQLEWATLALGAATIELTCYLQPPGSRAPAELEHAAGRAHVGIVVRDIAAVVRRLRALGATLRSPEPVTIAAGSYAGWLAIYAVDPDGTSVELFQRPRVSQRANASRGRSQSAT
jgi:catechol 2,3-dioxygenase-like lactoylglutathione lyase family enzyme